MSALQHFGACDCCKHSRKCVLAAVSGDRRVVICRFCAQAINAAWAQAFRADPDWVGKFQ